MVPEFSKLDDGEIELMLKAPILVCILIAGADGTIDKKEIKEGIAVASKQKKSKSVLAHYFKEVSTDFEDKVMILTQSYPYEPAERNSLIVQELAGLNPLLPKLDKEFAITFYEMLRDTALKIASSSGGLLGIKTVGSEEAKFVELSMINSPA
jgi:hypothetical protein